MRTMPFTFNATRDSEHGDVDRFRLASALFYPCDEAGITGAALGGVLILALQHSSLPAVSALLERGANPEALHDEDTCGPLPSPHTRPLCPHRHCHCACQ